MRLGARTLGATVLVAVATLHGSTAEAASTCATAADTAQDLRSSGKLREAKQQLQICASSKCNAVIRNDCEKWLSSVEQEIPTIVVRTVDNRGRDILNVKVTIDGSPIELDGNPIPLDPGQHVIKGKAKSGDSAEEKLLVASGEKGRAVQVHFTVPLEQDGSRAKEEKPVEGTVEHRGDTKQEPPSNVLPITFLAIGGVAAGVFGYFEISGQSAYSDLKNTCGRTAAKCSPQDIEAVRGKFVGAMVSLGVAAVALGVAGIVYFTRKSPSTTATSLLRGELRF